MSRLMQILAGLLLASALITVACGPPEPLAAPETATPTAELPWPDLTDADQAVREQLGSQRDELERLRAQSPLSIAELASAYGRMGLLLLTYEFFDAATICFENAKQLEPTNYRWVYLEGYLASMRGLLDDAGGLFRRALDLEPSYTPTLVRLAAIEEEKGAPEAARTRYLEVLRREAENAAAIAGLGRVEAALGNDEAATVHFERALELEPGANWLHYALGQAYRRTGDLDRARRHLEQRGDIQVAVHDPLTDAVALLGESAQFFLTRAGQAMNNRRYDIAADAYIRALERDPSDFAAWRGLAYSLQQLGDVTGSIDALEKGLAHGTTGDETLDKAQRAQVERLIGEAHVLGGGMSLGGDEAAVAAFRRSLALRAEDLEVRFLLANALARLASFEEALEEYQHILEAQPTNAEVLVRRGTVQVNLGRHEAALASFGEAADAAPDDASVHARYADALEYLGRTKEAATVRARAEHATTGVSDTGADLDLVLLDARRAMRESRFEDAITALENVLAEKPKSDTSSNTTELRLLLAAVYGHTERFRKAAAQFRAVNESQPGAEAAWKGEITALLLAGDWHQARDRLREALEVMPRSVSLAHALARLLASAPGSADRNGALAFELGQRLRAIQDDDAVRETLAMALAELGRFEEAAALQNTTSAIAGSGQAALLARRRLEAYQRDQPWVAESAHETLEVLAGAGS